MNKKAVSRLVFVFGMSVLAVGCGKSGNVSVQSGAFNTSGPALTARALSPMVTPPTTTVSTFKICVTQVKLEGEGGKMMQKDGADAMEFKPGLIDLSTGGAISWGNMSNVPVGFKLQMVKMEVHKDPASCGGFPYSVQFNNQTLTDDVEMKFVFNPPVDINDGDAIKLGLSNFVGNIRMAGDAGNLGNLKAVIEGMQDSCSKN